MDLKNEWVHLPMYYTKVQKFVMTIDECALKLAKSVNGVVVRS